jgi:hypothetical protein
VFNFSKRRNDIAHAIARPFRWTILQSFDHVDPYEPMQFCATPPYYTGRKFDPQNTPEYLYTSIELAALATSLFYCQQEITKLVEADVG